MSSEPIEHLQARLHEFARARDWEKFHTPKSLAMALAGEIGELIEISQWMSPEEASAVMASARADDVRDELADVFIYLIWLADILDVELAGVVLDKLARIEDRYPVDRVRGRADRGPET